MQHSEVAVRVEVFVPHAVSGACQMYQGRAGYVSPGFACDQVRLHTPFAIDNNQLVRNLEFLDRQVRGQFGGDVWYVGKRPCGQGELQPALWQSTAYQALHHPLFAPSEGGNSAADLHRLVDTASCVIDFDVTERSAEERLLRYNLLNAVGPLVAAHAWRYFKHERTGRFRTWHYCSRRERLPQGWRWQPDCESYDREVKALTLGFALQQERARMGDMLATGVFHLAQQVNLGDRQVLRFWALPTLTLYQIGQCVSWVDEWLDQAVRAIDRIAPHPCSLEVACQHLPLYQGLPVPVSESARLYQLGQS